MTHTMVYHSFFFGSLLNSICGGVGVSMVAKRNGVQFTVDRSPKQSAFSVEMEKSQDQGALF